MFKKLVSVILLLSVFAGVFLTACGKKYPELEKIDPNSVYGLSRATYHAEPQMAYFDVEILKSVYSVNEKILLKIGIGHIDEIDWSRYDETHFFFKTENFSIFYESEIIIVEKIKTYNLIADSNFYYPPGYAYPRGKNGEFTYKANFSFYDYYEILPNIEKLSGRESIRIGTETFYFYFDEEKSEFLNWRVDQIFEMSAVSGTPIHGTKLEIAYGVAKYNYEEGKYKLQYDDETGEFKIFSLDDSTPFNTSITLYYVNSDEYIAFSAISEKDAQKKLDKYIKNLNKK